MKWLLALLVAVLFVGTAWGQPLESTLPSIWEGNNSAESVEICGEWDSDTTHIKWILWREESMWSYSEGGHLPDIYWHGIEVWWHKVVMDTCPHCGHAKETFNKSITLASRKFDLSESGKAAEFYNSWLKRLKANDLKLPADAYKVARPETLKLKMIDSVHSDWGLGIGTISESLKTDYGILFDWQELIDSVRAIIRRGMKKAPAGTLKFVPDFDLKEAK